MDKEKEICIVLNNQADGSCTISISIVLSRDWDIVTGSFTKISSDIKEKYPDHLVIIQNGCFYEVINEDVDFFEDRFSYNSFERFNNLVTGFPILSEKVFPELRDMKKMTRLNGLEALIYGQELSLSQRVMKASKK